VCIGSNKLFLEQNYGESYNVGLISKEADKRFQWYALLETILLVHVIGLEL
jgi:hypothetical protein